MIESQDRLSWYALYSTHQCLRSLPLTVIQAVLLHFYGFVYIVLVTISLLKLFHLFRTSVGNVNCENENLLLVFGTRSVM